jgi:hypothetical protein
MFGVFQGTPRHRRDLSRTGLFAELYENRHSEGKVASLTGPDGDVLVDLCFTKLCSQQRARGTYELYCDGAGGSVV